MAIVTRDSLAALIQRDPIRVVGRALVAIFNNQTEDERANNTTDVLNGIGFSGADARSGVITAKYFIKHGTLLDWQLERWIVATKNGYPRICKYAKQLNAIAESKAQSSAC